jgi:dynein light intermediate chain 1
VVSSVKIFYKSLCQYVWCFALTGDRQFGKTTLVAKLQGNVDPKKGSGLEYAYIDVRDEYRDGETISNCNDLTKLIIDVLSSLFLLDHTHSAEWLLDGNADHSHLLRYALTEETNSSTLMILTVSTTTPWAMIDQLHEWASLLQDHIDKLPFSAEAVREYQRKCIERFSVRFCFQNLIVTFIFIRCPKMAGICRTRR